MRILADEDFRGPILNALRTVLAESRLEFDIVRVQDIGLLGASDPTVLDHAARDGRVVVSCDILTMPPYAFDRIGKGMPMPGLIVSSPNEGEHPALPPRTWLWSCLNGLNVWAVGRIR